MGYGSTTNALLWRLNLPTRRTANLLLKGFLHWTAWFPRAHSRETRVQDFSVKSCFWCVHNVTFISMASTYTRNLVTGTDPLLLFSLIKTIVCSYVCIFFSFFFSFFMYFLSEFYITFGTFSYHRAIITLSIVWGSIFDQIPIPVFANSSDRSLSICFVTRFRRYRYLQYGFRKKIFNVLCFIQSMRHICFLYFVTAAISFGFLLRGKSGIIGLDSFKWIEIQSEMRVYI